MARLGWLQGVKPFQECGDASRSVSFRPEGRSQIGTMRLCPEGQGIEAVGFTFHSFDVGWGQPFNSVGLMMVGQVLAAV